MNNYIMPIVIALSIALISWLASIIYKRVMIWRHDLIIQGWLKSTTQNEPGESHKTLFEISVGTSLNEERVHTVCLESKYIYKSTDKPGYYSIWRKEPQSIYEKRGIIVM